MSLPAKYDSFQDYFTDVLTFFKDNEFLYNYANTEILINNTLSKISEKWSIELDDSDKVKNIFEDLNRLSQSKLDNLTVKIEIGKESISNRLAKGLSDKKIHEILNFSKFISEECHRNHLSLIVDLGCGLGYMTQILFENHGLRVLGIEANNERKITACNRQIKMHNKSIGAVHYVQHYVTSNSSKEIVQYLDQHFPGEKDFYLVGLHACADLTIDAIDLFLKIPRCKGLAIMPCCYHRMKIRDNKDDSLGEFLNIPLSEALKTAYLKCDAGKFIRQPFLRLCCQRATWRESDQSLDSRVFHLMSRAVLQLYAKNENLKIVKQKRRAVNRQESRKCNFESFIKNAVFHGYKFERIQNNAADFPLPEKAKLNNGSGNSEETEVEKTNIDENCVQKSNDETICDITMIWESLKQEDFSAASLLIKLQDSLQSLGENLILLDKLAYLQEKNDPSLSFECVKVVDENLSPRCYALVAKKI